MALEGAARGRQHAAILKPRWPQLPRPTRPRNCRALPTARRPLKGHPLRGSPLGLLSTPTTLAAAPGTHRLSVSNATPRAPVRLLPLARPARPLRGSRLSGNRVRLQMAGSLQASKQAGPPPSPRTCRLKALRTGLRGKYVTRAPWTVVRNLRSRPSPIGQPLRHHLLGKLATPSTGGALVEILKPWFC